MVPLAAPGIFGRPLDRVVEVLGFDQVEAAELLARLRERAVGEHPLAVAHADRGGGRGRLSPSPPFIMPAAPASRRTPRRRHRCAVLLGWGSRLVAVDRSARSSRDTSGSSRRPLAAFTLPTQGLRGIDRAGALPLVARRRPATRGARRSAASRRSRSPSSTSTGTARWPVRSSTSSRSRRRQATRRSSVSIPRRASSRATRPHGHRQFVGCGSGTGRREPSARKIGCARMAARRALSPTPRITCRAEVIARQVLASSRSTSTGTGAPTASATWPTTAPSTLLHLRRGELPTTSQPSVGDFLAVYEPLIEAGDDIALDPPLGRHLGDGGAGRAGPAGADREAASRRSASACWTRDGLRRPRADGDRGRQRRAAGADLEVAAAAPRRCATSMRILFAVDTLEYLRRGGRIGAAQAYLGSALRIKPILTIGAEIEPVERVRTAGRAVERLRELARAARGRRRPLRHPARPGPRVRASSSSSAGARSSATTRSFVSEVGPVIGTHVGPGLLGVAALPLGAGGPSQVAPLNVERAHAPAPGSPRPAPSCAWS